LAKSLESLRQVTFKGLFEAPSALQAACRVRFAIRQSFADFFHLFTTRGPQSDECPNHGSVPNAGKLPEIFLEV
jgi:hypothetical protein